MLKDSFITYVSHDIDGDWQFLGKEENLTTEDAMLVSMGEIIDHDPTLIKIIEELPQGKEAVRDEVNKEWIIL